ncbi:hypothetical protein BOX15_Mlig028048g2 [Macrostomum lignano]|uniref:Cytosolic fatty-acid binding proteins domain-containing protein n=1 Tax=Macrostomum lignano TaxID=282301 RepID=A0A267DHH1_9PLAT|nr:hypothetical protein BOX15_Mlig028048g2 [Macrostomum lignano]
MSTFEGKWQMTSSENFDAYMKALGTSFLVRKAAAAATPVQDIRCHGNGRYTIVTITSIKTIELNFTLDEEFDETTADGRQAKSVVTMATPGKLVHQQRGQPEVIITRQLEPDGQGFVMTLECKGVTCVRRYKRM